jgi:N-acyl-D-amino-acid deacylase
VLKQGATTTIGGERNFDGKTIFNIEKKGFLLNQGFHVSHSFTIRLAAGIKDRYRNATPKEIESMAYLTEQFFENGAYGIHFGLEYVPGTSFDEILSIANIAKKYNRVLLIHLRKDGQEAIETFKEIIEIGRITGVAIHILHLMYMVGFENIMDQALRIIDKAIKEGINITADTGLYAAFPSCIGSSILDYGWEKGYGKNIGVNNLLISSGIYSGTYCDDNMFKYLKEEFPNTLVTVFACDEKQIEKAIIKPYVYISTNAADGPHYMKIGHPETSGTFPRLISKYVVKEKIIDLVEAIRKITILPAQRFGITNKGAIIEGSDADVVIFDLDKIHEESDFIGSGDPNEPPKGIEYIIINGEIAVKNNTILTRTSGRLLKYT